VKASSRASMGFLSLVGNSFGCSASGERLVSAARDGDLQEARALLEYNPRLARYSTSGGRNTPLHYAAAQGHHEVCPLLFFFMNRHQHFLIAIPIAFNLVCCLDVQIVSLLLESGGVEINLRNFRGQVSLTLDSD
jgi:hypothetical protein